MPLRTNISNPVSKKWLRLDNAAKIFPIITNRVRTSVFRLSVELSEPVNIKILQDALDKTLTELPYFTSQLKKGFFWYWLEPTKVIPTVQYDDGPPCRLFAMSHRNHLLLRVLARKNIISAEFMHVLCDGAGGMQFLLCLVKNYGEKNNWEIDPSHNLISIDRSRQEELMEDSYKRYFNKYIPKPNSLSKAYHLPFKIGPNPEFKILPVQLNTQDIIARAKKYKISLTEYLASIYLFVIQGFYLEEARSKGKIKRSIIRIQIPVNLRNLFPSITLRNFALFIMPEIDPKLGAYSFEEITRIVHHYMQLETDKRQIMRIIRRNVGGEKILMVRAIPLFAKILVLFVAFSLFGPNIYSGLLTNVGRSNITGDWNKYIKKVRFYPPPPDHRIKVTSAMVSHGEHLILSFGNLTETMSFEREVIKFLQKEGLAVTILKA